MLQKLDARNEGELSHSPFLYVKTGRDRIELKGTYETQIFCGYILTAQLMPVGSSDTAFDLNFAKEVPWTSRKIDTVERESMKKGAGRVAQRRTDNKRRMRRQFPGDAYVWETDTSPGMG